MKKLIKSSMLLLGLFFFAGAAKAQLASDKPAMTAQQMADMIEKKKADAKLVATTTTTVENKVVATAPSNTQAGVVIKNEPAKTATQPVTTPVPTQGEVKPIQTASATETKLPQPVMQNDKPEAKKQ
jgi:hypothetical protein